MIIAIAIVGVVLADATGIAGIALIIAIADTMAEEHEGKIHLNEKTNLPGNFRHIFQKYAFMQGRHFSFFSGAGMAGEANIISWGVWERF